MNFPSGSPVTNVSVAASTASSRAATSASAGATAEKANGASPGLVILILVWVTAIFFALYQFGVSRLVDFDPNGQLANNASDMGFEAKVQAVLVGSGSSINGTVLHFTQDDCACNRIASSHIDSVKYLVEKAPLQTNAEVVITGDSPWRDLVPSTPAIAVFDDSGKLSYFGPYSSGYYCSAGNGLVEKFIGVPQKLGATVVSDSKGCYCAVN